MSGPEEERARLAVEADEEGIRTLLHDPSPRVIRTLLMNARLSEQDVLIIAGRKNLPGDLLEAIARDKRWMESYPLRLALAKNPKTPLHAALSIARSLRVFDLADLCGSRQLPAVFRHKVEALLSEKIPTLALGLKRTLAKTAGGTALLKLLQEQDAELVSACLQNPRLTEGHLYKVISRETTAPGTVRIIADHPAWSNRYSVRLALVRNIHTPLARIVPFISELRTLDLKNLYGDPSVPSGMRPYLHRELLERGIDPESILTSEEPCYEIPDGSEDAEEASQEE